MEGLRVRAGCQLFVSHHGICETEGSLTTVSVAPWKVGDWWLTRCDKLCDVSGAERGPGARHWDARNAVPGDAETQLHPRGKLAIPLPSASKCWYGSSQLFSAVFHFCHSIQIQVRGFCHLLSAGQYNSTVAEPLLIGLAVCNLLLVNPYKCTVEPLNISLGLL